MVDQTEKPDVFQETENEFSFERLLDPYREGGTPEQPVRRTMGSIVDYLVNRKKYSMEVAGAAVLIVFTEMKNGRKFKGNGSYGSPGAELVSEIRRVCDRLSRDNQQKQMYQFIADNVFKTIAQWAADEAIRQRKPWYRRLFSKEPPLKVTQDGTP